MSYVDGAAERIREVLATYEGDFVRDHNAPTTPDMETYVYLSPTIIRVLDVAIAAAVREATEGVLEEWRKDREEYRVEKDRLLAGIRSELAELPAESRQRLEGMAGRLARAIFIEHQIGNSPAEASIAETVLDSAFALAAA